MIIKESIFKPINKEEYLKRKKSKPHKYFWKQFSDQFDVPPYFNVKEKGKNWTAFRKGLPQENCYDIVYRNALAIEGDSLVFGSTTGNVYTSNDLGESWSLVSSDLPMVYSVELG